ncbi:hybrid sensor histidine kinase/response regulator [bacterium]|nr:hybrid sensor histidine kinase/response regulator [bacterium]
MLKKLDLKHDNNNSKAERAKILCVDDESAILNVMERGLSDDFDVLTAQSGKEGLEVLKANPGIVVILSDQKMGGMSGNDFLAESQKVIPDAIRIIVSAYSDVELLMESINRGHIYKFILKPFEIEGLRITIRRAAEHYHHKKAFEKAYRELEMTQQRLIRSEKMSLLGKLMSGVAHELGNPVANIRHAASLAGHEWAELKELFSKILKAESINDITDIKLFIQEKNIIQSVEDFEAIIHTIKNSSSFASEIIKDLRGFSRLDDIQWADVSLKDQIDRAIHLVQAKYKFNIEFHKELKLVAPIKGLPGPLTQVLVNLIHNSAQSIESNGGIWIKTWMDNGMANISIKDNGKGIPKDDLEKIFELGFTTKSEDEGTGLGLAICQGIIEKHNGKIAVQSEIGEGTEFIISLPVEQ